MAQPAKDHSQNAVLIDEKDVIIIAYRGAQTSETVTVTHNAAMDAFRQLQAQNKTIRILVDITGMTNISATARKRAQKKLAELPNGKVAVYGKGKWTTLAMYFERAGGMPKNTKVFASKSAALSWLFSEYYKKSRPLPTLIAGIIIMIIGALALIGWHIENQYLTQWISTLRPINPLSAGALLVTGFATVCYWAGRITIFRWCAVGSLLFGIAALLPLHIDYLLYGGRLTEYGAHVNVADSAAVCFVIMGIVGLIANRPQRWIHPIEFVLSGVLTLIALVNIFGQLYAREAIYSLDDGFVMAFNLAVAFAIAGIVLFMTVFYRHSGRSLLVSVSRIGWLVMSVLFMVQFATYGMWNQSIAHNKETASVAFAADAREVQEALSDRFTAYINALYGFQGLFLASTSVSQGEFETYYATTNVATNYPGLRALSFISKVTDAELPAFIAERKADKSLHPNGNPGFSITQKTDKPVHYIVTYLARSSNPPGADLSANASRVAAYQKAELTKKPVVSSTITFAATATAPSQDGFFITVPVAYQGSPEKAVGYVNAVFNYKTFFEDTFGNSVSDKLALKVTDTHDGTTVYDEPLRNNAEAALTYSTPIAVADRTWDLRVTAPESFGNTQSSLPMAILIGGQSLSVLLVIIFWMQARGRRQALNLADAITHDLQEERNLAVANNQKSTAILDSIGEGVFAIDTNERIVLLNPAAQSISGYTRAETLGRPYDECLHFETQKTGKINNSFIRKALKGHLASMSEGTIIVRKDGKRVPVADSAAPIRDSTGKIIGVIVVFRDVSKELELDKAKTEFVSLASHQLRTPLSAINWYGEMLLNGDAGKLTKDQHEYINEIFEGSQRMVELVNSLLNVSRLEIGKLVNQPAPNNLPQLVRDLEKEMQSQIQQRGLRVSEHIEKSMPSVVADPKQLRMIIQNLLSNAVKYTSDKGTVDVTLRMATKADIKDSGVKGHGAYWLFSVKDNGYGIPKDQQGKIFTKMFRADNVRKLDVEGTGLGLYIVKEVAEKMGGEVWFESVESVGTTFYVIAPIEPKKS